MAPPVGSSKLPQLIFILHGGIYVQDLHLDPGDMVVAGSGRSNYSAEGRGRRGILRPGPSNSSHFCPKLFGVYAALQIFQNRRVTDPSEGFIKIASDQGGLDRTDFFSSCLFFVFFRMSFLIEAPTHSSGCFEAFGLFHLLQDLCDPLNHFTLIH